MCLIVVDSIRIMLRKNEHISIVMSQTHGGQKTKVWWKNSGGDEVIQLLLSINLRRVWKENAADAL